MNPDQDVLYLTPMLEGRVATNYIMQYLRDAYGLGTTVAITN